MLSRYGSNNLSRFRFSWFCERKLCHRAWSVHLEINTWHTTTPWSTAMLSKWLTIVRLFRRVYLLADLASVTAPVKKRGRHTPLRTEPHRGKIFYALPSVAVCYQDMVMAWNNAFCCFGSLAMVGGNRPKKRYEDCVYKQKHVVLGSYLHVPLSILCSIPIWSMHFTFYAWWSLGLSCMHHEGGAGDVSPQSWGRGDNPLQYLAIF